MSKILRCICRFKRKFLEFHRCQIHTLTQKWISPKILVKIYLTLNRLNTNRHIWIIQIKRSPIIILMQLRSQISSHPSVASTNIIYKLQTKIRVISRKSKTILLGQTMAKKNGKGPS